MLFSEGGDNWGQNQKAEREVHACLWHWGWRTSPDPRGTRSALDVFCQQPTSLFTPAQTNVHYKKKKKNSVNRFFSMSPFQLATLMLPEEENFLLLFRRETPLDNSVEFMRVRVKGQQIMAWWGMEEDGYLMSNSVEEHFTNQRLISTFLVPFGIYLHISKTP